MSVSITTSGTQTATIGAEHSLVTLTTPGIYVLVVDCSALVNGEAVELRIYGKVSSSGQTERQIYMLPVVNVQADAQKVSLPVVSAIHFRATLTQAAGTSRSFNWAIYQL